MTVVTKLLKAHVKIRSFLWVTQNMNKRNILLVTKLELAKIWNTIRIILFHYMFYSYMFI